MRVIIVGAGEVGYNIASRLASENKQVVVIDKDQNAAQHILENLDVQVITASGSSPKVLIDAGITRADILLAVTDSDEINLIACLMTSLISPATKKIARLRDKDFEPFHEPLKNEKPHIDAVINPGTEVVKAIRKLMDVPGATDVGYFAGSKIKYIGMRIEKDSPMSGMPLNDFTTQFGKDRPLIAAIIRNNEIIVPRGNNQIKLGDLIYFISKPGKLEKTLSFFGKKLEPIQRALIIGGGRIGERLAKTLEKDGIKTKIIESDIDRCNYLSEQMDKAIILHGDGSDQKLFAEENARQSDVIVSVTNDDETNILVSLLAKNLGIRNTITRIEKSGYFPLLANIGIEKVVNPRLSAVSSILQTIRKGKILSDISIFDEQGEFIEAVALETSDITDKPLKKISFPKGTIIVCIFQDDQVVIPTGESIVKPGDRIILFAEKQAVKKLEKLLTGKLDFF